MPLEAVHEAIAYGLADIPFTDGSASKIRPVLVLWLDGLDAVVSVVTSAVPRSPADARQL